MGMKEKNTNPGVRNEKKNKNNNKKKKKNKRGEGKCGEERG